MDRTKATIAAALTGLAMLAGLAFANHGVAATKVEQVVYVVGGSLVLTDAIGTTKLAPGTAYPATGYWVTLVPGTGTVFEAVWFDSSGTELDFGSGNGGGDFNQGTALTAGSMYEYKFGVTSAFQLDFRPATTGTMLFVVQEIEGTAR